MFNDEYVTIYELCDGVWAISTQIEEWTYSVFQLICDVTKEQSQDQCDVTINFVKCKVADTYKK